MAGESVKGTRVIALVGPAGAGKTSLAEAMLFAAGATDRLGSTANGSSIGDSSPESRQRGGSTELNLYNFKYLGDDFAILDVPGSIGFSADGARALAVADVAIVVVDPDPRGLPSLPRPCARSTSWASRTSSSSTGSTRRTAASGTSCQRCSRSASRRSSPGRFRSGMAKRSAASSISPLNGRSNIARARSPSESRSRPRSKSARSRRARTCSNSSPTTTTSFSSSF